VFIRQGHFTKSVLFRLMLAFVLSVAATHAFSQKEKDLITQADRLFQQENYPESMQLYSQLLSLHRNDPFYSYRFGVSMLYSDRRDPNAAIRYIETGIGKLQGDDEVLINFHLATAYHMAFRFAEALKFYTLFSETAIHKKFLVYNAEQRIRMCREGVNLLQNIRDLYVFERHHVQAEYFFRSYDISKFGGRLLVKPEMFKSKFDKKINETTIVFLSDTQQVVYYSSLGRDGKTGKDIYRSFKKGDGSWGHPERLSDVINTEFDEDYPFILPDGNTLYFSSKGHSSMGGYDVFRTTWDEIEQEWTTPVNLDFAINTPYDDILFVTDRDEQFAWFSSVRNSGLGHMNVYKVRIDVRPDDAPDDLLSQAISLNADAGDASYLDAVRQIQQIANLEVNVKQDDFDRQEAERRKKLYADNYKYNISDNPTDDELIGLSFSYVSQAERTLELLKYKQLAAEISADRFMERNKLYEAEAEKFYAMAHAETDGEVKKARSEQAVELSRQAAKAEADALQTTELAQELSKSVEFHTKEYERILFRAGEIQKLASGRQIDTSVVLLKKLIDDIKTYEVVISEYVEKTFPSPELLTTYEVNLQEALTETENMNNRLDEIGIEKDLYQNELHLTRDEQKRKLINEEISLIEEEALSLQQQKSTLNKNIVRMESDRNELEKLMQSPEYAILSDVIEVEKIIVQYPDDYQEKLPADDVLSDLVLPEDTSLQGDTARLKDETAALNNTSSPETMAPDTTDSFVTETADIRQVYSDEQIYRSEDGINPDIKPDVAEKQDVDVQQTDVITDSVFYDVDVIVEQTDMQNEADRDDNTTTEVSEKRGFTSISSHEKRQYFDDLLNSDQPLRLKVDEIVSIFEDEKAVISLRRQLLEKDIATLVIHIEETEKEISTLNDQQNNPGLSNYERRMNDILAEKLMLNYRSDIQKLEELLIIYDLTLEQQTQTEIVAEKIFEDARKITSSLDQGRERKASSEFDKLSAYVVSDDQIIFQDDHSAGISVRKYADEISGTADMYEMLARKADGRADKLEERSEKVFLKAENTRNETRKEELSFQGEDLQAQAVLLRDSADFYRKAEANIRNHSSSVNLAQADITGFYNRFSESAFELDIRNETLPEYEVFPEKMQRMKLLIAENPHSDQFELVVSKSNQWNNLFDKQQASVAEQFLIPEAMSGTIEKSRPQIDDVSQLREMADKEQVYVLRSSATLRIAGIRKLEEEISKANDPREIYNLFAEMNHLQNDLEEIVEKHNEIAARYADIEPISAEHITEFDAGKTDFSTALFLVSGLSDKLSAETERLEQQIAKNDSGTPSTVLRSRLGETEMLLAQNELRMLELITLAEENDRLLLKMITGSLPVTDINIQDEEKIVTLTEQSREYETHAAGLRSQAAGLQNMNQKMNLYLQAYDYTVKSLEIQQEIFRLYQNYNDAEEQYILKEIISELTGNQQQVAQYLKEMPQELRPDITAFADDVNHDSPDVIRTESDVIETAVVQPADSFSDQRQEEQTEVADMRETTADTGDVTTSVASAEIESPDLPDTFEFVERREFVAVQPTDTGRSLIVTDRQSPSFVAYYSSADPIPEHFAPDGKLLFRVQFAASKRQAADNVYAGMTPLFYEYSGGWYRYMHGEFYRPDAAVEAREKVRTLGYNDAFVVAYYNGVRISFGEGRNIFASQTSSPVEPDRMSITTDGSVPSPTSSTIALSQLDGFYYAVQIGVYGSPRSSERLFGITPLIEDRMANGNYRYLTGIYTSLAEANESRDRIRANGVPDAFVVVYRNGVRISVREAQDYIAAGENPQSTGITAKSDVSQGAEEQKFSRAENIFYKVQLGAYRNQVPVEVVNAFIAIAEEGIQIITDSQGLTIYLAGKFKTLADADILKNKVQSGGITDAFIVAVEGEKKISLQEAKDIIGQ
jgi:cell division protein FtsN